MIPWGEVVFCQPSHPRDNIALYRRHLKFGWVGRGSPKLEVALVFGAKKHKDADGPAMPGTVFHKRLFFSKNVNSIPACET